MKSPASKYEWLRTMRDAGAVQRYHTSIMLRGCTDAAHSWGVALVLLALGVDSPHVLAYALLHDSAELFTGDIPANAKWEWPELEVALRKVEAEINGAMGVAALKAELSTLELALVKFADMYELCQCCILDAQLGNTLVRPMLNRALNALGKRYATALGEMVDINKNTDDISHLMNSLLNDAQPFIQEQA